MRIKCHGASQVPSMGLTCGCIRDKEKRPEAKLLAEGWSRIGPQVAIAPTPVSLHGPVDTCLCLVVTRLTPEGELLGTASSWAIPEGRGQGDDRDLTSLQEGKESGGLESHQEPTPSGPPTYCVTLGYSSGLSGLLFFVK